MRDRLIHAGWRGSVLVMILITGLLALATAYRALFALLTGAWPITLTLLCVATAAGIGAKWLCENRDELVEA